METAMFRRAASGILYVRDESEVVAVDLGGR